jgi:hypothetical protein
MIDLEEDKTLKAVIWGLLREIERRWAIPHLPRRLHIRGRSRVHI